MCCFCTTTDLILRGPFFTDPYFNEFYDKDFIEAKFAKDCSEIKAQNLFKTLDSIDDSLLKLVHGDIEYESYNGNYNVLIDLHQLHIKEIAIKIHGGIITVDGKQKQIGSPFGKSFERTYNPSTNIDLDQAECNLSSDGILLITAPKVIISKQTDNENHGCCIGCFNFLKSILNISTTRLMISRKHLSKERRKSLEELKKGSN